jgi:ADP-heptose:LPS heptosyltransferase
VFVAETPPARLATATYSIDARTWGPSERLGAWRALGLDPQPVFPALAPTAASTASILRALGDEPRPWTLLHPYGRTADQWWPPDEVAAFVREARTRFGGTVLVVGGRPGERRPGPAAAASVDLFGKLTLDELLALIATSDSVVTTDSGPFHVAGAMGRRGVGLFRASRPEHAARYPSMASVISPAIPECRTACTWDRCAVTPCRQMRAISGERVAEAAAR